MQFLNFETNKMEDVKYFAIQNGIVLGIIEDSDKWYTYYFIMEHKKIFDSFTNDNRSQLCLISNEKGEPYKVFKTSFDSIGFEFTKDYEVIRKLIFGERKAIVENSY